MCQGKIHILDIMSDVPKGRIPYSSTTALMFIEEHISTIWKFWLRLVDEQEVEKIFYEQTLSWNQY